ncbi:MAG: phenylalanine--tRNA ligase subunit beta, partial [Pseudomonadota bacterium]
MLVSLHWLKEFVDIDASAEEIADLLTMGGIEVEGINHVGQGLDAVYTARIEEIRPHPASDKLNLVRINIGDREETVVCGARNTRVGQIVPYAPPGAKLPSGLEVTAREVRGVASPGMIISEKEIGLGEDHSGVLVLEDSTPVGVSFTKAFPFAEDYILETSVTPNRGDCLSILGTAREVAALSGRKGHMPSV